MTSQSTSSTDLLVSLAVYGIDILFVLERRASKDGREAEDIAEEAQRVGHRAQREFPSRGKDPA